MGGSSSRQKRIEKRQFIYSKKQECQNTFNSSINQHLETNNHPEVSVLNNIPVYRHHPIDYECSSISRENNSTKVVKSSDTHKNQACQLLCDDLGNHDEFREISNFSDYTASEIQLNTANLEKKNCSKDVYVSSFTLKSQINSGNENRQTSTDEISELKPKSWQFDERTSGVGSSTELLGKSSTKLKQLLNSPVKRVHQKVPNNDKQQVSLTDDCYYETSNTKFQYGGHNSLPNLDYANIDDNDVDLFSGVEHFDNKFNHQLSFDILDILSFPVEWTSCALDTIGFVDVIPESDEGRAIIRLFHRTSVSVSFKLQITSVTRIENPFLHSLYMLKKEEMESRNGHVDELYLYHGTKSENVNQICDENLNWRLYTDKHRFGRGVSFSPSAIYSSHYSDSSNKKVMFLFKVLVSNAEFGSSDMVIPSIQSGVAFDTSIKDDISVVVKYSDNEFYPLYKIMYTRHANA